MSSSVTHPPRQNRRSNWALYLLGILIAIAVLLAIAGETYEAIARGRDERNFRRWGELVDVGGYRLNLNCLGAGTPTVVLDSALGLPAAEWSLVQPDVAEFTRVCSYDRAGYGWSSLGPFPRTSAQISQELHTLLQNGGVRPPYILVGHSFGGHNVRVYTHEHPNEVAGMILVEAAHEEQLERLPAQFKDSDQQQARSLHHWQPVMPILIHLGVERFMLQSQPRHGIPSDVLQEIRYLQLSAKSFDSTLGEMDAMPESITEVRASGGLGDRPLLVLTGADAGEDLPPQVDREAFRKIWITELQPSLAHLSSRGKQVIVPDAGHLIPLQQPQAVVAAIKQMVDAVRTGR
jgi:pimeloyl-ACP methyl ester carboxylesterase